MSIGNSGNLRSDATSVINTAEDIEMEDLSFHSASGCLLSACQVKIGFRTTRNLAQNSRFSLFIQNYVRLWKPLYILGFLIKVVKVKQIKQNSVFHT